MNVLVVCSSNSGNIAPFIAEQAQSLKNQGLNIHFFLIKGKGIGGYLKNLKSLKLEIRNKNIGIVHAHYGLSGFLANFQRDIPTITTFHGSDVNLKKNRIFSNLALLLSAHSIFISEKLARLTIAKNKFTILPCGVDLTVFYPISQHEARTLLGFGINEKILLFSGSFSEKVKNFPLASTSITLLNEQVRIIELKGYSRNEVNLLMNACDLALMTSFSEGSPQFIKEAMACNLPIVSVDVGDVKQIFGTTTGCHLTSHEPMDIAEKINLAFGFKNRTNGRERIIELGLSLDKVASHLVSIYNSVLETGYV